VTGKRELNKQRQYFDFLAVATRLFEDNGVENTTMLEIAAKSGTVTKTLNRYFPTKNALVLAIMKEDDRVSIDRLKLKSRINLDDPIESIVKLFSVYVDYSNIIKHLSVWREYEAVCILEYGSERNCTESVNLRSGVISIVNEVLKKALKEGLLEEYTSVDDMTDMIHAITLLNYHKALRGHFTSDDEAVASLRCNLRSLMTPFLTRRIA